MIYFLTRNIKQTWLEKSDSPFPCSLPPQGRERGTLGKDPVVRDQDLGLGLAGSHTHGTHKVKGAQTATGNDHFTFISKAL